MTENLRTLCRGKRLNAGKFLRGEVCVGRRTRLTEKVVPRKDLRVGKVSSVGKFGVDESLCEGKV